jgi:cytochrome c oxidase cbb3-type subunit 3
MFDSDLFVNPFWSWFIIILTSLGIIGCFVLIIWMSGDDRPDNKTETMGHVWDETLEEYNNPLPRWWLNMFYITLVFGIIYLVVYPGMGSFVGIWKWTEIKEYQQEVDAANNRYGPLYEQHLKKPITELVKNPEALKIGERLYLTYCTVCHGSDGGGALGFPNLRDKDWLWGGTPEAIETSILKGRKAGGMAAWKTTLGGDQGVKDVAQYVMSLSGKSVDQAAAERGKAKFSICMACHGPEGKGNPMLGAPNLTDDIWLYGGTQEVIEQSIAAGRAGIMPAHLEFLGEAKVHLLATYVYSLSNSQ